jgi:DNA polymerase-3 subunit delta
MPIYFFWGEDDFALSQAVKELEKSVLDPNWLQFNYDRIDGQEATAVIDALNQAMTPVFGMGGRLIWLADTSLAQGCPEEFLAELERTLPQIPEFAHLLLTSSKKPDARLKSTKLLNQYAEVREFSPIPPWNKEAILARVKQVVTTKGVKFTSKAMELLAESVGNDARRLDNELDKLSLYSSNQTIDHDVVAQLVRCDTHNSLQLATAMCQGNLSEALTLISELISQNEPALRILATLVGQFRTWTIIKLMMEKGEKDEKAIASAADLNNPKRIYFLKQEISHLSSEKLLATLPILLELEASLKLGGEPISTLQTKIIEICQICR